MIEIIYIYIYKNDDIFPIFLPIIGEYNGYGGIKNITIDNYIESLLGVSIENLLRYLDNNYSFKSISDMEKQKQSPYYIKSEDDENFIKILKKLYKLLYKVPCINLNLSLCYTMERLDVYLKMAEISNNIDKKIERSWEIINKEDLIVNKINFKNFAEIYSSKLGKESNISECIKLPQECSPGRYVGLAYNNIDLKANQLNDAKLFIKFNKTLSNIGGTYLINSYCPEEVWDVSGKILQELNKVYKNIITHNIS